jgi:MFS transporter, DHA2 family, multidrug resistance protein
MSIADTDTDAAATPETLKGLMLFSAGFALSFTNFIVVLDLTIANVSVPHIAGGLAISPTQGTWAITSYAVAEAITVPLAGWLAARFGTVRWFIVSLIGFGLFSLLCGLASTIEMLVVFRVFQGLSGGPLMPLSQSLLTRIFPESKRSLALGLWGATTVSAPIMGPILGGYISDNYTWPWIFFVNVPLLAGCILFSLRNLPRYETVRVRSPIDKVGLALLVLWVAAFQLMLDIGRDHDWFGSPVVIMLAAIALIGFVAFIIWELFDENPVVNIRLLSDRTLALSNVAMGLTFSAFFMALVLVPLWLQQQMGYTAWLAGLAVSYAGVAALLAAPLAAMLLNRVDLRITIGAGSVFMALSALSRSAWYTDSEYATIAFTQFCMGIGLTFFALGIASLALSNLSQKDMTSAAGILTFVRVMSGAFGTALATTIWENSAQQYHGDLAAAMHGVSAAMSRLGQAGMSSEQARSWLGMLVDKQAYTLGAVHVYAISGVIFVLATVTMFFVPKPKGTFSSSAAH